MTDRMMTVKSRKNDNYYSQGYSDGYRLGVCEAIIQRIPQAQSYTRDMKVLFIPQGFEAIDHGVSSALQSMVRECIVVDAPLMLEVAIREQPDLVLVLNGLHVFPEDHLDDIRKIREMGIKTAIWFADDPYFTEYTQGMCTKYDIVFTHELSCVPFYHNLGAESVYYLPLGVNPQMFYPQKSGPEHRYDICFIGNAFWNRVSMFDEMAPFLANKKVLIAGGSWERLTQLPALQHCVRDGFIPPEETARYYNGSKVVINIHRPVESGQDNKNCCQLPGRSINPRTYEINACGAMQITDIREDLSFYYRPGYDIETYTTVTELQNKIEYYLKHDKERQQIAYRGLWTTRNEHTFMSRVQTLLEHI